MAQQKKWASDSDKLVKATKKLGSVKKNTSQRIRTLTTIDYGTSLVLFIVVV